MEAKTEINHGNLKAFYVRGFVFCLFLGTVLS